MDAHYTANEPNTIYLNRSELVQREDTNYIARTVLHEWVHKQTYDVVVNQNGNTRTDRQQELVRNLRNLMNEAMNKRNMPTDVKRGITDQETEQGQLMEFMAWTMGNQQAQKWLNSVRVSDEHESMLQSLVNTLQELVTTIIESVGFDVSRNSSLKYTLRDTINLIETTKARDSVNDNPESVSKSERTEENQTEENNVESSEDAEQLKMQFTEQVKDLSQTSPLEQQLTAGKTIGEMRRNLTDRQKEIFDNNRNRFQTEC